MQKSKAGEEHDEWISELVAATSNAIEAHSLADNPDSETSLYLIATIGLCIVYANDAILELAEVLQTREHVNAAANLKYTERDPIIKMLGNEVDGLLKA